MIAGAIVGLAAAMALTGLMKSLLFGVQPLDPTTYVVTALALATVAVAACAIPALRATRVDPIVALRDQ